MYLKRVTRSVNLNRHKQKKKEIRRWIYRRAATIFAAQRFVLDYRNGEIQRGDRSRRRSKRTEREKVETEEERKNSVFVGIPV